MTTTTTALYRLDSVIDNWPHRGHRYKDVPVTWWVESRSYDPRFDYETLLGRPLWVGPYSYEQGLIDEMFTRSEADQFAAYLKAEFDEDVTVTEVAAPIPATTPEGAGYVPTGAIPVGGSSDFHMLSEHEGYSLPFKVWGYYDVAMTDWELATERTAS